jgi:hypothetical protein
MLNSKFILDNTRFIVLAFLFPFFGLGQVTEVMGTPGSGFWEVPCGVSSITVHIYGANA